MDWQIDIYAQAAVSPRSVPRKRYRRHTNADIAKELFLSEGTVRNYVSSLFIKLGVNDRTQAAVVALKHGLVN